MMGPDYTHWHGTYDLAKHFYSEMIPDLEHLVEQGARSGVPEKEAAAEALKTRLDRLFESPEHRWFVGDMDPAEKAERERRQKEFQQRYGK